MDDIEDFVEILIALNTTMDLSSSFTLQDVPGGRWPAVKCVEPAEPEAIDGATVGTIIVASFIGVTLIGGAIAVYQSSS